MFPSFGILPLYWMLVLVLLFTNLPLITLFVACWVEERAPTHRGISVRSFVTLFLGAGVEVIILLLMTWG